MIIALLETTKTNFCIFASNKLATNKDIDATILMVTHDPFSASYASRVIFLKDGKIFNEIRRGNENRKDFFEKIIDVVSLLGGELNSVI